MTLQGIKELSPFGLSSRLVLSRNIKGVASQRVFGRACYGRFGNNLTILGRMVVKLCTVVADKAGNMSKALDWM